MEGVSVQLPSRGAVPPLLVSAEVVVVPKGDLMGWYLRRVKYPLCSWGWTPFPPAVAEYMWTGSLARPPGLRDSFRATRLISSTDFWNDRILNSVQGINTYVGRPQQWSGL
jgi:hypothetical protein